MPISSKLKTAFLVFTGAAVAVIPIFVFAPQEPMLQEPVLQEPSPFPEQQASFPLATFYGSEGPIEIMVEVADTDEERGQGLMFRETLAQNTGMLFVFDHDTQGAFWMKNTLIPLDIIFIDAKERIVEILPMQPCAADPCGLYLSSAPYRYALEVNQGFAKRHGIKIGDVVTLPDP